MTHRLTKNLIAVDIGNSRMKIGRFVRGGDSSSSDDSNKLPEPNATFDLAIDHATGGFATGKLTAWCDEHAADDATWYVASVHRGASDRLTSAVAEWAKAARAAPSIRRLSYRDVSIEIRVDAPERVGIDRLLAALAADKLRRRDGTAVVVDLGTAITVDLLDAAGAFCGGAILPGIAMSARALAEHTDALPRVAMELLETPPAAVGKSTVPAIESGLYWGAVGAVRELIAQMSAGLPAAPDVFLTGGASAHVAELLAVNSAYEVRHEPHLVLAGIALVQT
jgi:type III pantothenate kinase